MIAFDVEGMVKKLESPMAKAMLTAQIGKEGYESVKLLLGSFALASRIEPITRADLLDMANLFQHEQETAADLRVVGAKLVLMGIEKEMV